MCICLCSKLALKHKEPYQTNLFYFVYLKKFLINFLNIQERLAINESQGGLFLKSVIYFYFVQKFVQYFEDI